MNTLMRTLYRLTRRIRRGFDLTRPVLVSVNGRTGVLVGHEVGELGGWALVDFGDQRPLWFPAHAITLAPARP
jgi:hypothetical protein